MESSEAFAALRVAVAVGVLAYASLSDLRTRRVDNRFWIIMTLIGILLLSAQVVVDDKPLKYLAILAPIVLILADVFVDSKLPERTAKTLAAAEYALAIILLAALLLSFGSDRYFRPLAAVPAMMLFVVLLYMLDAIRGGADAKALISISVLFPFYPAIGNLPLLRAETPELEAFIPFAFAVLVTAAIVVALTPIGLILRNMLKGEVRFPQAFFGYMVDIDEARGRHLWLMERVVDGKLVYYTRPKAEEDLGKELDFLATVGQKRVWVTPKIPFIVPIFIGLCLCVVLGNPLLLLFPL